MRSYWPAKATPIVDRENKLIRILRNCEKRFDGVRTHKLASISINAEKKELLAASVS